VTQDHLVIELAIDPALDDALDVAEVAHHVPRIECIAADVDFHDGVVPMRMPADAVIIHQAVAVAELDPLGDRVHSPVMLIPKSE
jgi:hypothetical protein